MPRTRSPRPRWPDVKSPGGERIRTILGGILSAARASQDPLAAIVEADAIRWRDRPVGASFASAEGCARIEAARAAARLDPPHWDLAHRILDDSAPPAPPRKRRAARRPSRVSRAKTVRKAKKRP